ncbi:hypothetical protein [Ktedonobacter racemifer]|nr:hypothetical protein [Ktedonobacter racemifer]
MPNLERREEADISYFTLLLVTTSDLYVLKPLTEIEVFQNAKELEEVSFKTNCLSVIAERSPLMYQYCIRLVKDSLKNKRNSRIDIEEASLLADQLIPRTIQIFVTNITNLENMLSSIKFTALSDFRKECKLTIL